MLWFFKNTSYSLSKNWNWIPHSLLQQPDPLPSQEMGNEGLLSPSDVYSPPLEWACVEDTLL